MSDRTAAHKKRDVAPAGLLLGEHAHRRDTRPTRDEQQIPGRSLDDERRAKRAEQIEAVAFASGRDPFAPGAERFDDELDLTGSAVDAIERVRPAQQRIERRTGASVHELAGPRWTGDTGRGDPQHRAQLADLGRRRDASVLEDHSGTPTAKV